MVVTFQVKILELRVEKENLKMELALIGADEVREDTKQPDEVTIPKEEITEEEEINDFEVSNGLKVVLEDVLDLTTGGMEMHGFKRHTLMHPTRDYEVDYFIKGSNVVMADYHGTNYVKIEVLGLNEANIIIDTIKGVY